MADYVHSHPLDILSTPDDDGLPRFSDSSGIGSGEIARRTQCHVRGPDAEAGRLPRLDTVPKKRQDPHICIHVSCRRFRRAVWGGPKMKKLLIIAAILAITLVTIWSGPAFSHETLTTTVLFDREIVQVLNRRCVMCHFEKGPSLLTRNIRADLASRAADSCQRHRPPHAAVEGSFRLWPFRQRQQPDVARNSVRRVVGGRPGAKKWRNGVYQYRG